MFAFVFEFMVDVDPLVPSFCCCCFFGGPSIPIHIILTFVFDSMVDNVHLFHSAVFRSVLYCFVVGSEFTSTLCTFVFDVMVDVVPLFPSVVGEGPMSLTTSLLSFSIP